MKNKRMRIASSLTLLLAVLSVTIPAVGQESTIVPIEAARLAAQAHIDAEMHKGTVPAWEGAIPADPVTYYDPDGSVAVYVFSVHADGENRGFVTVSGYKHPTILEFSTAPAPHATASTLGTRPEHLVFLGPLLYVYPVFNTVETASTFVMLDGTRTLHLSDSELSEMSSAWKRSVDKSAKPAVEDGIAGPQANQTLNVVAVRQGCSTVRPCDCGVCGGMCADSICGTSNRCWVGCHPAAGSSIMKYWSDHGYGGLGSNTDAIMVSLHQYMNTDQCGATTRPNSAAGIASYAASNGHNVDTSCISTHWGCNGQAPTFQQLVDEIDAGRPVILAFNGHANTGIGYDTDGQIAVLNSNLGSDPRYVPWSEIASYTGNAAAGIIIIHPCAPDTTPPTQASNVRPNGWSGPYTSDHTPDFRWDPASDSGSGMAGYYVAVDDWTPDGGYGNDWWVGNVTAFTVPEAQSDGEHIFAVTSKDNGGNVNPENTNQPGDAPYCTFVVDTVAPSSAVSPLAAEQESESFTVYWDGSDATSGIASYDVQYRDGPDGSWITWRRDATFTWTIFTGQCGHIYYFRSRARDRAGNVEGWPPGDGDTHTTVHLYKRHLPLITRDYDKQVTELSYDDGSFEFGFMALPGLIGAVKFDVPPGTQVLKLKFHIWGEMPDTRVHVLDATQNSVYSRVVTPSPGWFEVDVSDNNVFVNGDFYVGLQWISQSADSPWPEGPWLGVDTDPPYNQRSYLGPEGNLFHKGSGSPDEQKEDYMIRVVVRAPE